MSLKTYRAASIAEALERVRNDLGGGAVIVESRERRRRFFGLGRARDYVEVRAARAGAADTGRWRDKLRIDPGQSFAATSALHIQVGEQLGRLHDMVAQLSDRGRVDHLLPDLPSELASMYAQLIDAEVPELRARQLARSAAEALGPHELQDPQQIHEAFAAAIAESLPIAPPIVTLRGHRRTVALVGPTGVGKTTTVAKLAATFKLVHGLQLGLVTVDTYRIAAVEQLRTYAEIIGVPLKVASTAAELRTALDALGAVDLVLIDTAGRSPRDGEKLAELSSILASARPDEVHLVLSATTSPKGVRAIVDQFGQVHPDRLILTKVDESQGVGGVLSVIGQSTLPISYVTTGQAVPDDIEAADRQRLAAWILDAELPVPTSVNSSADL